MSKAQPLKPLDEKKLLALNPPIRVSVIKRYGGQRATPIPMPPAKMDANFGPGEGYDHNDVRSEVSKIVLRKGGGGNYDVTLSDEQGGMHEYALWFDTITFPDLIPQEHADAAPQRQPAPVIQMPQPQVQVVQQQPQAQPQLVMAAAGGGGVPVEWSSYVQPGVVRGVAPAAAQQFMQASQPGLVYVTDQRAPAAAPAAAASSAGIDERMRHLEEQNRLLREQIIQKENVSAREREIGPLRDELRELKKIAERPREDDTARALADVAGALRELKEKGKDEAAGGMMQMFMLMMNKADEAARETARRSEAQAAQFQQLLVTLTGQKPAGPDPIMLILLEHLKGQGEREKETVRAITEAGKERDRNALSIRDVLDMTQKMNDANGAGALLKNVGEAYSSVFSMAKMATEMIANVDKGGGSPAQELIGTALQRAGDVAQNYIQMRRDAAIGESQARQAEAVAQARMAGIGAQPAGQPPLGAGAPPAPMPPGIPGGPQPGQPLPPAQMPGGPPAHFTAVQREMWEREIQMFGPAVEAVRRLRAGVAAGKVTPEETVHWIFQALSIVAEKNWNVPALAYYQSDQLSIFVDVLLPEGPKEFVRRLGVLLVEAKQRGGPPMISSSPPTAPAGPPPPRAKENGPGDDDDDDEDDDDEDEVPHSN